MIKEALMDNDFLKNLSSNQVREIVDYMEIKKVPTGAYVIREGDSGMHDKKNKNNLTKNIIHFWSYLLFHFSRIPFVRLCIRRL